MPQSFRPTSPCWSCSVLGLAWVIACPIQASTQSLPSSSADRGRLAILATNFSDRIPSNAGLVPTPQTKPQTSADSEFGEHIPLHKIAKERETANWDPWSVAVDAECFYTDNVGLASAGALEDFYIRSGFQARYTNRIQENWFLNVGLDSHALVHDKFPELDFLMTRGDASLVYLASWLADTHFSLGYSGYHLTDSSFSDSAFTNHSAVLSGQKTWKPTRGLKILAGGSADFSLSAAPRPPMRHEYSLFAGGSLKMFDDVLLSANYRLGWFQYPELERGDWNHVLALGVSYELSEFVRIGLVASLAANRSSIPVFDYDNLVTGLSVTLHFEF